MTVQNPQTIVQSLAKGPSCTVSEYGFSSGVHVYLGFCKFQNQTVSDLKWRANIHNRSEALDICYSLICKNAVCKVCHDEIQLLLIIINPPPNPPLLSALWSFIVGLG